MAVTNKKYLDYEGLQYYDSLIKNAMPEPDGTTITVVDGKWQAHSANRTEVDAENEMLKIYNLEAVPAVSNETLLL